MIRPVPKPEKRSTEKRRRAQNHAQETGDIRRAVMLRSGGKCECGGSVAHAPGSPLQMDHALGGSGRRRQQQSEATCWMLAIGCHTQRTLNVPSAEYWRDRFRAHCARHGYPDPFGTPVRVEVKPEAAAIARTISALAAAKRDAPYPLKTRIAQVLADARVEAGIIERAGR